MEEIKLLKELGLDEHLHILGYVIIFSFIVKTLYKSHIQQLINDMRDVISSLSGKISESLRPSLYDILPEKAKRAFDIIEAIWSYLVSVVSTIYLVLFIILSKFIQWNSFDLNKGILYFGTLIIFFVCAMASVSNGNKAVQRYRGILS